MSERQTAEVAELLTALSTESGREGFALPLGRRSRLMTERYLQRLTRMLSRRLRRSLGISVGDNGALQPPLPELLRSSVAIHLQVYQHQLVIVLPFEAAGEIAAAVLGETRPPIFRAPSEEEVTALTYAVASALAEEELFLPQRVYLAAVVVGAADDNGGVLEELRALPLKLTLGSSQFSGCCLLHERLVGRLELYSRLEPLPRAPQPVASAKTRWSLILNVSSMPLPGLLSLQQGDVLALKGPLQGRVEQVGAAESRPGAVMEVSVTGTTPAGALLLKVAED